MANRHSMGRREAGSRQAATRVAVSGAAFGNALVAVCLYAGAANTAWGDVTTEQRISVVGAGILSAGNMTGTTKTTTSGDRARTDSDMQLQSRFVRMLAHGAMGPAAQIVRLDQGKIYHLDLKKKQYTEVTFEEMRARMQKALDQAGQADQPSQAQKPFDDSKCEWLEPKVEVNRSGEKTTIAGYDAERLAITASQPCKDKETGAICEVALSLDEWLAPKFAAAAETAEFRQAYAQRIGLSSGAYAHDVSDRAQAMFSRYKGVWSEIAARTKDVKGYPVKTSFAFAVGGTQCRNTQARQASESAEESSSSAASPTGSGSITGQIGSKIAGAFFRRKKNNSQTSASSEADGSAPTVQTSALPPGLVPLMTISSELVSVSTDKAMPDAFEVPADFKKVEQKTE